MRIHVLAILAAAAMAAPEPASAATVIHGTLAASMVRVRSSTRVIGDGSVLTNKSTAVNDAIGQFDPVLDGSLALKLDTITATPSSIVKFVSTAFGTYLGVVDSIQVNPAGAGRTLTILSSGTFTPIGPISAYAPGPASIIFSFAQSGGAGSSISGSFTLQSGVPEPMGWALLLTGAGMAGGAVRRSRKKASPVLA